MGSKTVEKYVTLWLPAEDVETITEKIYQNITYTKLLPPTKTLTENIIAELRVHQIRDKHFAPEDREIARRSQKIAPTFEPLLLEVKEILYILTLLPVNSVAAQHIQDQVSSIV